jgi:hypothetical protein
VVFVQEKIGYEVVDFGGEVGYCKLSNGTYAVDPLFLEQFKIIMKSKETA